MVKLSNGKEIEIDLYNVTRKDWKDFINPRGSLDAEDKFVMKATGLSQNEIDELPEPDFRLLVTAIIGERRKVVDPNSRSAST